VRDAMAQREIVRSETMPLVGLQSAQRQRHREAVNSLIK
jgi:hypothetical protein